MSEGNRNESGSKSSESGGSQLPSSAAQNTAARVQYAGGVPWLHFDRPPTKEQLEHLFNSLLSSSREAPTTQEVSAPETDQPVLPGPVSASGTEHERRSAVRTFQGSEPRETLNGEPPVCPTEVTASSSQSSGELPEPRPNGGGRSEDHD